MTTRIVIEAMSEPTRGTPPTQQNSRSSGHGDEDDAYEGSRTHWRPLDDDELELEAEELDDATFGIKSGSGRELDDIRPRRLRQGKGDGLTAVGLASSGTN